MTKQHDAGALGNLEEIPEERIQKEMDAVSLSYFRTVAMAFTVYYFLRGVTYITKFPPDIGPRLAVLMLPGAVYGFTLYLFARQKKLSPRAVDWNSFLIGLLVIANVFWNMYLTGNRNQFMSAGIAVIAFGLATTVFRIWLVQVALCLILYVYAMTRMPIIYTEILSLMAACLCLSAAAFFTRVPAMRHRIELQLQLEDKAAKLAAASKAKDRFMANMTHELRTPMTGVLGMMNLLRETKLSREQNELLDMAKTSAGYLLAIINDVLDFSKMEAGKFELKPAPMDAVAITRDVVEVLQAQAAIKGIALELVLPDEPVIPVRGDGVRIGQVLFNLLGNAIKFTERGGVYVTLEAQKGMLEWQVRDTGPGIEPGRLARLFERFEQADSSATRGQPGTGLGLAIIRELLGLMGGHIEVTSELGKGSEFRFSVPLDRIPKEMLPHHVEAATMPHGPKAPLRILVAEDNLINQVLVQRLLEREGWDVVLVDNGEAAVAMVTSPHQHFDLVLMDVQMPVLDGVQATQQIKAQLASPPPIVALTANTMKDDVASYLEAGMDAHVGKPIDVAELHFTIRRVLGARALPQTGT